MLQSLAALSSSGQTQEQQLRQKWPAFGNDLRGLGKKLPGLGNCWPGTAWRSSGSSNRATNVTVRQVRGSQQAAATAPHTPSRNLQGGPEQDRSESRPAWLQEWGARLRMRRLARQRQQQQDYQHEPEQAGAAAANDAAAAAAVGGHCSSSAAAPCTPACSQAQGHRQHARLRRHYCRRCSATQCKHWCG